MSHEMIRLLFSLINVIFYIGFLVIIFLIIRGIWRAFKRFVFEVIDHVKGTSTSNPKYTAEAWKAYEDVTKKRKQDTKPPWEE